MKKRKMHLIGEKMNYNQKLNYNTIPAPTAEENDDVEKKNSSPKSTHKNLEVMKALSYQKIVQRNMYDMGREIKQKIEFIEPTLLQGDLSSILPKITSPQKSHEPRGFLRSSLRFENKKIEDSLGPGQYDVTKSLIADTMHSVKSQPGLGFGSNTNRLAVIGPSYENTGPGPGQYMPIDVQKMIANHAKGVSSSVPSPKTINVRTRKFIRPEYPGPGSYEPNHYVVEKSLSPMRSIFQGITPRGIGVVKDSSDVPPVGSYTIDRTLLPSLHHNNNGNSSFFQSPKYGGLNRVITPKRELVASIAAAQDLKNASGLVHFVMNVDKCNLIKQRREKRKSDQMLTPHPVELSINKSIDKPETKSAKSSLKYLSIRKPPNFISIIGSKEYIL
jgi:hypothetical protein